MAVAGTALQAEATSMTRSPVQAFELMSDASAFGLNRSAFILVLQLSFKPAELCLKGGPAGPRKKTKKTRHARSTG